MSEVKGYRDLKVWQKAMDLADMAYDIVDAMPTDYKYTLISQIQRCAASVPANIAEGRARHSDKDFQYHLSVARGSLAELETLMLLAQKRSLVTSEELHAFLTLSEEVTKMIYGLKSSLATPKKMAS